MPPGCRYVASTQLLLEERVGDDAAAHTLSLGRASLYLRSMRLHGGVAFGAFLFASVINPGYFVGCVATPGDPQFQYGAAEMSTFARAASSSYERRHTTSLEAEYRVDVDVEPVTAPAHAAVQRSAFASTAHACGNRQLSATASACFDYSTMAVTGTVTIVRLHQGATDEIIAADLATQGTLMVGSLTLSGGGMQLALVSGTVQLQSRDGKTFELSSMQLTELGESKLDLSWPL
jgi:hypothetical protein